MKGVKGFTMVELMVVIAIMGILAAYIGPNYLEGVRKAKVAEFISMFSEISVKEHQYFSESRRFLPISEGNWKKELQTNFEMMIDAKFFDYKVEVGADGDTFIITATLNRDLGRAKKGATVTVDQENNKAFPNDPDGGLESYTTGWKDL